MSPARYRTVREEEPFTRAVQQIERRFPRVRGVEEGISWLLARVPERQYRIPDTRYHLYETADPGIPDIPVVRVLYWFDDDMVYLVDAMLVE